MNPGDISYIEKDANDTFNLDDSSVPFDQSVQYQTSGLFDNKDVNGYGDDDDEGSEDSMKFGDDLLNELGVVL